MSENKHTPEPWQVFEDDPRAIVTKENPMLSLLSVGEDGLAIMYEEADARRIVACVNACAGVDTAWLETMAKVGGFAVMNQYIAAYNQAAAAIMAEKQRDELLAAAEAIEINAEECMDFDDCTAMLVPIDDYHKLMEAIAGVKGGA